MTRGHIIISTLPLNFRCNSVPWIHIEESLDSYFFLRFCQIMPDIVLDWLGVFSPPKRLKTQNSNGDDADDADIYIMMMCLSVCHEK